MLTCVGLYGHVGQNLDHVVTRFLLYSLRYTILFLSVVFSFLTLRGTSILSILSCVTNIFPSTPLLRLGIYLSCLLFLDTESTPLLRLDHLSIGYGFRLTQPITRLLLFSWFSLLVIRARVSLVICPLVLQVRVSGFRFKLLVFWIAHIFDSTCRHLLI
jgi:hypothetical protein